MFFVLSKILAFLLYPLTWIVILIILAILKKDIKKVKTTLKILLVFIFVFGNSFLATEAFRLWEIPPTHQKNLTHYKLGIILGGGMAMYDQQLDRIHYPHTPDRFLQAIDLYKKGYIDKLFLVGGSGSLIYRDVKEALLLKKLFLQLGIPEKDILVESESDNTYQNALNAARIIDSCHLSDKTHLLITSGYHMRRSLACFKKANLHTIAYSTNIQSGLRRYNFEHLVIPKTNNFHQWYLLLHEIIGCAIYKVQGYM